MSCPSRCDGLSFACGSPVARLSLAKTSQAVRRTWQGSKRSGLAAAFGKRTGKQACEQASFERVLFRNSIGLDPPLASLIEFWNKTPSGPWTQRPVTASRAISSGGRSCKDRSSTLADQGGIQALRSRSFRLASKSVAGSQTAVDTRRRRASKNAIIFRRLPAESDAAHA